MWHIGGRPVLTIGNSDGDLEMVEFVRGGNPDLAYLIHHTDADREFQYDREYLWSPLVKGLEANPAIPLIDMKKDWATVWSTAAPISLD